MRTSLKIDPSRRGWINDDFKPAASAELVVANCKETETSQGTSLATVHAPTSGVEQCEPDRSTGYVPKVSPRGAT